MNVRSCVRIAGVVLVSCVVSALGCLFLTGCDESDSRQAGRVFDYNVTEQDVIDYIEDYREGSATVSDEDWAAWMAKKSTTAEKLRKEVVTYLCENWLVERAASLRDVSVSDGEIDGELEELKSKYPSEIAWQRAIINSGYTEETYKLTIKSDLLKERIKETFADPATVSDDELETYANNQMTNTTTKGTSAIYIKTDDESGKFAAKAKAQDARTSLKSGVSFSEVFAEYSDTTYSSDGDMGYTLISVPNLQYRNAVNELREIGDISDVVEADDGYYVIVLTDIFEDKEDGTIKLAKFPEALLEGFREQLAVEKADDAYNEFLTENVSEAQIAIEPMPEGLPYDIEPTTTSDSEDSDKSVD